MPNTARIRSINIGQLATATDRLLVLGLPKRANLARGSSDCIERAITRTMVVAPLSVRRVQPGRSRRLAIAVVVALGIVLGFGTTRITIAAAQHAALAHTP